MKYINKINKWNYLKFESILTKSYTEITDDNWSEYSSKWYESTNGKITDKEYNIIKNLVTPYPYIKIQKINPVYKSFTPSLILTDERYNIYNFIKIYKDNDEWYHVSTNFKSYERYSLYKCDQIDGLVDCLKEILK